MDYFLINKLNKNKKPSLNIITTIFNEESNIPVFINDIQKTLSTLKNINYNFILVDNGSTDNSLKLIKSLSSKNKKIKYVSLLRNFGHQGGLLAGLSFSKSDITITMDCDLQHPSKLIPRMIKSWTDGYKVVSAVKNPEKGVIYFFKNLFYKSLSKLSKLEFLYGQSDFRLIDKSVLKEINSINDQKIFLRGAIEWMGFKSIKIKYDVNKRLYGSTKFNFFNYISFAFDGILNHSYFPIRIFTLGGIFLSSICILYLIYLSISYFFIGLSLPPGWLSVIFIITLFSSLNLIGLGVLGEYIARIFEQIKDRPKFIIIEKNI